jgi:hypothetical protein
VGPHRGRGLSGHGADGVVAETNNGGEMVEEPVECMRRPIENNASPGQAVYEPFSGSVPVEVREWIRPALGVA